MYIGSDITAKPERNKKKKGKDDSWKVNTIKNI